MYPADDIIQQLFGATRERFLTDCFGKRHFHYRSDATVALASELPGLQGFAELLALSAVNPADVQLTSNGKPGRTPLLTNGALDLQAVWSEFYDGTSIVMNNLHKIDGRTKKLCHALFACLGHRLGANAYLTPPSAAAFSTHYDTHDVIVIQLSGEKQWSLFSQPDEVPSQYHEQLKLDAAVLEARPLAEPVLKAGDVLYIPRGYPHRARTEKGSSLHVTFGLEPIDFGDILTAAAGILRHQDVLFREQISSDLFLDPGARPRPESLRRLAETFARPEFMARVMQAVRKQAIQNEPLGVAPRFDTVDAGSATLRWCPDAYCETREMQDSSVIVSNGVKATHFSNVEAVIFRRIYAAGTTAAIDAREIAEPAYLLVVNRLTALGLVEPVDA